ncbi:hypothetical protein BRC85_09130 [Halobacteriales archaeon QS_1_69_70]|nr:MAG: hypothetical protein BRC85_09130 [Halobacteriales archaeon QS_1_69_70]
MKRYATVLAILLVVAGAAGVVAADDGPLAAAGLDQEVGVDTTVQLDGTGSSHPDGRIDGYEWSIETPDGRTITPDCRDCARTTFTPRTVGRYNVTLTVTDADGRTDNDTLYVHVEKAGPTVELSGDTEPQVDDPTPYDASAEARDADLETLTWKLGNREPQTYHLIVIATDTANRTTRDTLTIEPQDPPEAVGGDTGTSTGTTTPTTTSSTKADSGETNHECEEAAVVRAAGAGPPAVVTCVDGKDPDFVGKWAEEKCSADISDCRFVDPDGMDGYYGEDRGDDNGGRVNELSVDDRGSNMRNPDNPTNGGSTGGRGYNGGHIAKF